MPTIWEMYVSWCLISNSGDVGQLVFSLVSYMSCQQFGGCMSVGVFICFVYIMPVGMNVSWCFCWYHVNNWWDKCKLFGVFGVGSLWALRPLGGGM